MIVSKEEFVEIINRLKKTDEVINKIDNIFNNATEYIITVIKLLKKIFNDEDVLEYWLYEKNYGRNYKEGDIIENGKKIDLSTPEKLYDYLIQNLEGNK